MYFTIRFSKDICNKYIFGHNLLSRFNTIGLDILLNFNISEHEIIALYKNYNLKGNIEVILDNTNIYNYENIDKDHYVLYIYNENDIRAYNHKLNKKLLKHIKGSLLENLAFILNIFIASIFIKL